MTIETELQYLKEIGHQGSEVYALKEIYFKKERKRLATIILTNKVKTTVNSISFTEESLRTTRDDH
jgi:hypothetical protein